MGAIVKLDSNSRETTGHEQYLTFTLDSEMFGVGILAVKEIIEYDSVTAVPMMPECVRGVINLRGAVVPVVDLACRFGRPPRPITRRTCIVIIEVHNDDERQDLGLIVDTVSEVLEIPSSDIEPPPAFGARIRSDFIAGMGKLDRHFVIILATDKVLCLDDLGQLVEQLSTSGDAALLPLAVEGHQ